MKCSSFNFLVLITGLFFLVFHKDSVAQGLEDIIVETYYVSGAAEASIPGNFALPEGSVTYRIFIDMKPGYTLQSVYGAPGHEMILKTGTYFYNDPMHGHYISNLVMERMLPGHALMLDSWIAMGAASQQRYGVLKAEDDTSYTIVNLSEPPSMQGSHPLAGIPVKERDGIMLGDTLPPRVSQLGLDTLLDVLYKQNIPMNGYVFRTDNGGWGCLGGAQGVDPAKNHVLIGQFTTNGDFYFEFNIQIGSAEHGVEQYVARKPMGNEQMHSGLIISRPALVKGNSDN